MTKTPEEYVADIDIKAHAGRLADILGDGYAQVLSMAYEEGAKQTGAKISFELTNPKVQDTIKSLGKRVKGITDTTKTRLQNAIGEALKGEIDPDTGKLNVPGIPEIAKRLKEIGVTESTARAEMISRTETGHAYNLGAIASYDDAGVTHVEVLDGDDDAVCSESNGQKWTLDEAQANPLGHPGCTRAFLPVIE